MNRLKRKRGKSMKKIEVDTSVINEFPRKQGYVISVANSKGGVGKTTISNMLAYNYAKLGLKTLIIDADKQGNATKTMLLTKEYHMGPDADVTIKKTLMQGLQDGNLKDTIIPIMDNLDLIPSGKDTSDFSKHLYLNIDDDIDREYFLQDAVRNVQFFYDVVIIDSPPNNAEIVRNVALASDYIIIAYHPAESSTTGAEDFQLDISELKENPEYDVKLEILGVLLSMVEKRSRTESYYAHYIAHESPYFKEEDIFKNPLYLMQRVKEFDINGIKEEDLWDKDTVNKFQVVAVEALERLVGIAAGKGGV